MCKKETIKRWKTVFTNHFVIEGNILKKLETKTVDAAENDVEYPDFVKDIVIPDGVTEIGLEAFFGDPIKSVVIPQSVTNIHGEAFAYCYDLSNVTMQNGTAVIGHRAFAYCKNLESIILPESVNKIDAEAFYCCEKLRKVIFYNKDTNLFFDDWELGNFYKDVFEGCSPQLSFYAPAGGLVEEYAQAEGIDFEPLPTVPRG